MLVNITKASKLAGIGRETLYKNYINKGKISVSRDEMDRPVIDTSEILRVFGRLHGTAPTHNEHTHTPHNTTPQDTPPHTQNTPDFSEKISYLQAENAQLKERLTETRETLARREQESQEREQWQRVQIEKLTDTIKLLEAPRPAPRPSFFARLLASLK